MPATDSHDGLKHDADPAPPAAAERGGSANIPYATVFNAGDVVGGSYEVIAQLGEGAMGMVFRVKHVSMPAEYALKVLTTEQLNENAVIRFQNEAQAIAKLNHPNLVGIYNYGLHEGHLPFYVMDLLSGDNLLEKLDRDGPLPLESALPLFIEVCAGLGYAHRKGIVHRDVKPANFVILKSPDVRGATVKVVDFGLVKYAEEIKPDIQRLTAVGEVCGSPVYMSPEQTTAQKIDPRSDIYSLGCSLYQTLTGKVPFRGRNTTETMMMQHDTPAPTLARKGDGRKYPKDLEILVAKMLEKAPMDRYQSMEAVAQDLKNVLDRKPLSRAPEQVTSAGRGTGDFGSRQDLAGLSQSNVRATAAGGSSSDRDQSRNDGKTRYDGEESDAPGADLSIAKPIALAVLALALLGCIGFFAWQALQPAKTTSSGDQTTTRSVATDGASTGTSTGAEGSKASLSYAVSPIVVQTPSPPEANGPITLTKARYFSSPISDNGREFTVFDFPQSTGDEFLGWIATTNTSGQAISGKTRFVRGVPLLFTPGPDILNVPHFVEKFRPGEITGLYFNPAFVTEQLFDCAAKTPGVSRLVMAECPQLSEKIIPSLSKLKLTVFDATASAIDSQKLATLPFLKDLVDLNISACHNVTPILKKIAGSVRLDRLDVSATELKVGDFQQIARLPNLRHLNITDNKVTAGDLRTLSRLPNLSELAALRSGLGGHSLVEELKHFPALKLVAVAQGSITKDDRQLLKKECPGLLVQEVPENSMRGMYAGMSRHHGGGPSWMRAAMERFGVDGPTVRSGDVAGGDRQGWRGWNGDVAGGDRKRRRGRDGDMAGGDRQRWRGWDGDTGQGEHHGLRGMYGDMRPGGDGLPEMPGSPHGEDGH